MNYLRVQALQKWYGSQCILKDIHFTAEKGEFLSLLGPSGSGKTTLLRCLAGLERPDAVAAISQIELDGQLLYSSQPNLFVPPEKRRLGMVFQNYAVWPHLSVAENVSFPLRMQARALGLTPAAIETQVKRSLSLVRLEGLGHRFSHELSGGQQQRVALARAISYSPRLLLLDEPLSNLDALLRDELGTEIRRLQQELQLTVLLVTHDQKEALALSDRILVLNHGQIVADDRPENLYFRPSNDFVAEFISGGQFLTNREGKKALYLPRQWVVNPTPSGSETVLARVSSRIFLGKEFEYWAQSDHFSEPFRFFSTSRFEAGTPLHIRYDYGSRGESTG